MLKKIRSSHLCSSLFFTLNWCRDVSLDIRAVLCTTSGFMMDCVAAAGVWLNWTCAIAVTVLAEC